MLEPGIEATSTMQVHELPPQPPPPNKVVFIRVPSATHLALTALANKQKTSVNLLVGKAIDKLIGK